MASAYLPFLIQAVLAALVTGGIIGLSTLVGQKSTHSNLKDSPYECGVAGEGMVPARFSVKFFLTALLFMLFDLEIVILLPWTFIYREFLAWHVAILGPILFFIAVLVVGLLYEIKNGALEWKNKPVAAPVAASIVAAFAVAAFAVAAFVRTRTAPRPAR